MVKPSIPRLVFALSFLLPIGALAVVAEPAKESRIEFNRDIRPILAENCFACHGPDRNKRQANLRLDDRESALQRGVIVPDRPERSALVQRINTADPAR